MVVRPGPAARLAAVNDTGEELEVLGTDGEPFLRIGPAGTYANVNHIDWYRSGNPDGQATPPPGADIGSGPRFERVSSEPEWAWFDHRLHPGTVQVSPEAREAQRTARLDEWTVPARLGGDAIEINGDAAVGVPRDLAESGRDPRRHGRREGLGHRAGRYAFR